MNRTLQSARALVAIGLPGLGVLVLVFTPRLIIKLLKIRVSAVPNARFSPVDGKVRPAVIMSSQCAKLARPDRDPLTSDRGSPV